VRNVAASEAETFPRADLRVDVPLVEIPVHVTTQLGVSVTNLKTESFRLFEDKMEQKIVSFTSEDAPVSIGLLFDLSGSMKDKMRKASDAAIEILKTANQEDEFFLIEFNDRPKLVVPFTRDVSEIQQELAGAKPRGQTSLLDAIHLAVSEMKNARHLRKALIIVSDGGDNHSRHSETEIKEDMLEADVQVYAMGIFGDDGVRGRTREEREGPRLLSDLAEKTGGRHFPVKQLGELAGVCARIGNELRSQYLLGYFSTNRDRDGKYRHIRVAVDPPAGAPLVKARYRLGYYAPTE
jgi:Ca-activated chloride channel homolog